jgi:hypothetical protein
MATHYSEETNGKLDVAGRSAIEPHAYNADLKRLRATVPYDGQAADDTIVLGELPAGAVFSHGIIIASATAGATATIAIGNEDAAGKYRAAATFTAANTPTLFGLASAADDDPVEGVERIIATIAAAALPDSANFMVIDIFYSSPSH